MLIGQDGVFFSGGSAAWINQLVCPLDTGRNILAELEFAF